MSSFDTHAAVNALRSAGIEEHQAEAIVNTVRDVVRASSAVRTPSYRKSGNKPSDDALIGGVSKSVGSGGRHRRLNVQTAVPNARSPTSRTTVSAVDPTDFDAFEGGKAAREIPLYDDARPGNQPDLSQRS